MTTTTTRTRTASKPAAGSTTARKSTTARQTRTAKVENLSAQIASATGAETDKPALTVVGGAGKSATGDNGHGRARAAAQRAATSAKPAARASKASTDAAAKPVRTTAATTSTGPTPTEQKRTVANLMCKAVADMLSRWDSKKTGVDSQLAAQMAAGWLNYAPISEWDSRLPDRSGAGGRGAKNRRGA